MWRHRIRVKHYYHVHRIGKFRLLYNTKTSSLNSHTERFISGGRTRTRNILFHVTIRSSILSDPEIIITHFQGSYAIAYVWTSIVDHFWIYIIKRKHILKAFTTSPLLRSTHNWKIKCFISTHYWIVNLYR